MTNEWPGWDEIHREEYDHARRIRAEQRSRTTPEERRETKRANRRYRRDRWRAWRWEHPADVMS